MQPHEGRLRVHYRLRLAPGESPEGRALALAVEQTVEMPADLVPDAARERATGRVEAVEVEAGTARATLSFEPALAGADLGRLVNVLFGNASMQSGVLVEEVEWPRALLDGFAGPRLGIAGIRDLCGVPDRPLLCAAAKPVGAPSELLAERCAMVARAGIDVVKDDHGLADQPWAPFAERVARCQEAVERANRETGGRTLYLPHVTGAWPELVEQARRARSLGCAGVLVSPLVVGLESARRLAAESGLGVLAHPALSGAFFDPGHGIAPAVLLGDLFRLAGSDGVVFPNVGGRFALDADACLAIVDNSRRHLGNLAPSLPVPGGGIELERVGYWIERYGADTMFLLGSSLYRQPDLERAVQRLVRTVEQHAQ